MKLDQTIIAVSYRRWELYKGSTNSIDSFPFSPRCISRKKRNDSDDVCFPREFRCSARPYSFYACRTEHRKRKRSRKLTNRLVHFVLISIRSTKYDKTALVRDDDGVTIARHMVTMTIRETITTVIVTTMTKTRISHDNDSIMTMIGGDNDVDNANVNENGDDYRLSTITMVMMVTMVTTITTTTVTITTRRRQI